MTVTEYIGARYVPIFGRIGETSVQWDNSAPYEPLTVVLYQGNSYTSRQYVPAGIAITNENYWVETGNWNAQIEAYRQQVLTFDGRITANEQNIATQGSSIEALQDKTNYLCPEQFGAVGDGTMDDTAAFEDMLAAVNPNDTIILQSDKEYRITSTLTIDTDHLSMTSFGRSGNKPNVIFDLGDDPASYVDQHLFEVTKNSFACSRILFGTRMKTKLYPGVNATGNYLFAMNTQNLPSDSRYDIDAEFFDCCFWNAGNVFSLEGRNVHIHECLFSEITFSCIVIHKLTMDQGVTKGLRGYRIENNRFHVAGWVIDTTDVTTYPNTFNLVIKDNFFDFCSVIYTGISDNVCIENNVMFQTTRASTFVIRITNTVNDFTTCNIIGNFINTFGSPTSGLQGPAYGFVSVANIAFGTMNISSNTFSTESDVSDNTPVILVSNGTNLILINITGNMLRSNNNSTPIQIPSSRASGLITGNTIVTANSNYYITAPETFIVENNYTGHFPPTE